MNMTSSDLEGVPSEEEENFKMLRTKKKRVAILPDSSEDESFDVQENSYESVAGTASEDEENQVLGKKKKVAAFIPDTSEDESYDVQENSFENVSGTVSEDEKQVLGKKKKIAAIIPDTSEDESFDVQENSYENVTGTASEDEENQVLGKKKKVAAIIPDTSEDESYNVQENTFENVSGTVSEDEKQVLGKKKKIAAIIPDTSEDESFDVQENSYENVTGTASEHEENQVLGKKKKAAAIIPNSSEDEFHDVQENSFENVAGTVSDNNDNQVLGKNKKKPSIIPDTSEDESYDVQKNSLDNVSATSAKDESFNNISTNLYEKVDKTDVSQGILNDSASQLGMHEPKLNKLEDEIQINNSIMMTPRTVKAVIDSDSEVEIVEASTDEEDVVEYIPSARKRAQRNSPSINKFSNGFSHTDQGLSLENQASEILNSEDELATAEEYHNQKKKVESLESDMQKLKATLRTVNVSVLPDGGEMLAARLSSLESALETNRAKLMKMKVKEELPSQVKPVVSWDELQASSTTVHPKTFGKRAMATYNAQKALTMESLQQLHGSIESCPREDTVTTDPKGLRVMLMEHQRQALAWLLWRENQKPSGGILADDMGLGKTLTMIALILKQRENQDSNDSSDEENVPHNRRHRYNGGTLIVCPASLLKQWEEEVNKHCKRYLLSVEPYHGPKRETRAKSLAKYDMVITTYSICMSEFEKSTPINNIYWRRIILDEAHQIKNFKSITSKAVCDLSAKSRWVLTGTPVHNKELDMYSLLKFLRCSPFDDIAVWKRWVSDKSHGGQERLHTVLSSLMLRRTKQQLQEKGTLMCLPDRHWDLIEITLSKDETSVYQKILIFSRTLFAQFLHQRAEKEADCRESVDYANVYKGNDEYYKMHKTLLKLNKVRTVQQHHILMLLLRLRQICCHPSLITGMLQGEELGDGEHQDEMNILEQLNKLNLDDDFDGSLQNLSINDDKENDNLAQNCRTLLNPGNPVFGEEYKSSKIQAVIKKIKDRVLQSNDKAVVVSQFTSFLKIIAIHLKQENICFEQLDGSVPVFKRKDIVANFNNQKHPTRILLLSLTAGGVGLNLIGGNHLFLLDLHWNPQLEMQAQDRIYRVGQAKTVYVYKFITADTIEQRIKNLQDKKLDLANSMLTGAKLQQSKLTIEDLKMLFNM